MADALVDRDGRSAEELRRRRGAARLDPAGAARDRSAGSSARNGAGKTTTIKVLLGMARPTSGRRARVRPAGRRRAAERRDPPPHRLRQRRQGSLRLHDRRRDDPLHRAVLPALAARSRSSAICAAFELPADRKVKALSRGMRTKLALLLALCRGAELLILDEPTSGLDPAMTEEVLQALVSPRRARRDDGVLLVAPDRRSRSDCRPRRDHRSRPGGGGGRARRSARALSAGSSWCSTATRRRRRSGRPASSACGARDACSRVALERGRRRRSSTRRAR